MERNGELWKAKLIMCTAKGCYESALETDTDGTYWSTVIHVHNVRAIYCRSVASLLLPCGLQGSRMQKSTSSKSGRWICWTGAVRREVSLLIRLPIALHHEDWFFPAIFRCWAAEMRRLLRRSNCSLFAERLRFPASAPCWSIWQTYIWLYLSFAEVATFVRPALVLPCWFWSVCWHSGDFQDFQEFKCLADSDSPLKRSFCLSSSSQFDRCCIRVVFRLSYYIYQ
jgi:hypothetical protein